MGTKKILCQLPHIASIQNSFWCVRWLLRCINENMKKKGGLEEKQLVAAFKLALFSPTLSCNRCEDESQRSWGCHHCDVRINIMKD